MTIIRTRRAGSPGYTLIELLTVIAVIAVLTAILLPVFWSAREKSRASSCLSNYHQIGLAIQMYATDSDGATPPDGGSFSGIIADSVPYIRNTAIFTCPDDFDRAKESRAGSYRMPSDYQGLPLNCGWKDPYNTTVVAQASKTTLCYEAEQDFSSAPIVPTFRHHDGTQLLYFDGHAKWVPKDRDYGPSDD